ncbi:hypothetical protein L873DRAFT_1786644 [Choiromyces venosus 120613-1]|uniref:ABM domain-containing protein n=1 Tax=Choiromyces venosus 120613-1 TaxID=1336337 RepID=A0A3N4K078_9PEZI|nr:hypothetical protein L873DRAFT_1786644 [Choiromyces venosus 120613-1]
MTEIAQLITFRTLGTSETAPVPDPKDLTSAGGFLGGNSGFHVKQDESIDTSNAYWVLTWKTKDNQTAFTQTSSFKNLTISCTCFPPSTTSSPPAPNPYSQTFSSPVVEWARMELCEGTDKQAYLEQFANFEAVLVKAKGKYVAHSVEFDDDRSRVLVICIGWESVEAHNSWIACDGGQEAVDKWIIPGNLRFPYRKKSNNWTWR